LIAVPGVAAADLCAGAPPCAGRTMAMQHAEHCDQRPAAWSSCCLRTAESDPAVSPSVPSPPATLATDGLHLERVSVDRLGGIPSQHDCRWTLRRPPDLYTAHSALLI